MLLKTDSGKIYTAHFTHQILAECPEPKHRKLAWRVAERKAEKLGGPIDLYIPPCGITYCTIHEGKCTSREDTGACTMPSVVHGEGHRRFDDPEDRAQGRFYAFKRAVHQLPLIERAELWYAYWLTVKDGRDIPKSRLIESVIRAKRRAMHA